MNLLQEGNLPSALQALNCVVFYDGQGKIVHQASVDINYTGGDFGRDQEAVALDLLLSQPTITHDTLISLAQKQGTSYDAPGTYPLTEVQPGRNHHERRSTNEPHHLRPHFPSVEEYRSFADITIQRSKMLIEQWGETYYGSVDSTPKFLILAREYLRVTHDFSLLEEEYIGTDGEKHTMRESLLKAAEWTYNNAVYGPNINPHDGQQHERLNPLLRFKMLNGVGIENPVMMDSRESFIYPDGTRANHNFPIADTGTQGQAYDALLFGAQLLRNSDYSDTAQQKANDWEEAAQGIQRNTLALWMEGENYFAMGEDIDGPIPTLCANVVELLASDIFDNLPENERQKYVSGITRMVLSPEFITEVGIRTRALRHINALVVDVDGQPTRFSDYHGVDAVWMEKLQWLIRGLSKHGLHSLADQMRMTFLDAVNTEGSLTEFFWVTPEGKPIHQSKNHISSESGTLNVTSLSEDGQAWTISAANAIKRYFGKPNRLTTKVGSWQKTLEEELLANMKENAFYKEAPMKTRRQVEDARERYRRGPQYTLNTTMGKIAQQALHQEWKGREAQEAVA